MTVKTFSKGGLGARPYFFPQIAWGKWSLRLLAVSYLFILIAVPIIVVSYKGFEQGLQVFWDSINNRIAYHALKMSLQTAAMAAVINTLMGTLTAYVLVKYRFPGKAIFNAFIDLPFALPTLVTGVMLVLLYGPQTVLGTFIEEQTQHRVIFAQPGIVLALLFVGYPFVIRTVQPVLMQLDLNQEEAAQTLGASGWETFWRVIFPSIRPAIIAGALLSFARGLGEFGSIIIVAGTAAKSQTATIYIFKKVEAGNMQAASGVSLVLLAIAFTITVTIDLLRGRRHA